MSFHVRIVDVVRLENLFARQAVALEVWNLEIFVN